MSLNIAGKRVRKGDVLHHHTLGMWGTVVDMDEDNSTAVIEFIGIGRGNVHRFTVTQGGNINGRRVLYWHEPIHLDLPTKDVSNVQKFVNLAAECFYERN